MFCHSLSGKFYLSQKINEPKFDPKLQNFWFLSQLKTFEILVFSTALLNLYLLDKDLSHLEMRPCPSFDGLVSHLLVEFREI